MTWVRRNRWDTVGEVFGLARYFFSQKSTAKCRVRFEFRIARSLMGWSPAFSNAHSTSPTIQVTNCAYFQILPQPSAPCNVPVAAIRRSEELSSLFSILFGHCSGFWFSPCLQVCFLTLIVFSVVIHNKSRCYIMLQFLSCRSPCTSSSFCLF